MAGSTERSARTVNWQPLRRAPDTRRTPGSLGISKILLLFFSQIKKIIYLCIDEKVAYIPRSAAPFL